MKYKKQRTSKKMVWLWINLSGTQRKGNGSRRMKTVTSRRGSRRTGADRVARNPNNPNQIKFWNFLIDMNMLFTQITCIFKIFKEWFIFIFVYDCFACMHLWVPCHVHDAHRGQKGPHVCLKVEVQTYEPRSRCWELYLQSMKEQSALDCWAFSPAPAGYS